MKRGLLVPVSTTQGPSSCLVEQAIDQCATRKPALGTPRLEKKIRSFRKNPPLPAVIRWLFTTTSLFPPPPPPSLPDRLVTPPANLSQLLLFSLLFCLALKPTSLL